MTLKIHSTEAERLAEYRICQERGHQKANMISNAINWHVCRHCGTNYTVKVTREVIESNKPEGAE